MKEQKTETLEKEETNFLLQNYFPEKLLTRELSEDLKTTLFLWSEKTIGKKIEYGLDEIELVLEKIIGELYSRNAIPKSDKFKPLHRLGFERTLKKIEMQRNPEIEKEKKPELSDFISKTKDSILVKNFVLLAKDSSDTNSDKINIQIKCQKENFSDYLNWIVKSRINEMISEEKKIIFSSFDGQKKNAFYVPLFDLVLIRKDPAIFSLEEDPENLTRPLGKFFPMRSGRKFTDVEELMNYFSGG